MVGRYAGDEFVVLLTQPTGPEVREAMRLVTAFGAEAIPLRERRER
jgi:GGDEF domain-containing protein